ncbi:MAG: RES domain-containing protein [Lewinellaceae bacterium]|nr:RES domain-containing protein [Lewinellaceae bacterium]
MIVYRIGKRKYAGDMSGRGAQMAGGRWNRKGIPAIYTSESRALSLLEVAVHLPLGMVPPSYSIATLEVPDALIEVLDPKPCPKTGIGFLRRMKRKNWAITFIGHEDPGLEGAFSHHPG